MDKDNTIFFDKIRPLRDEIDRIDSDILSLLARRQTQVEQVVALKKAHNMPVYHPAREEDLISRLRSQATKARVDPDFMEDLYRVILRQSRLKQTRKMELKSIRPDAKILVVGGLGQMGGLFAGLFVRSGYEVRILEKGDWENAGALCKDVDLVLVSVPIEKTNEVIDTLAPMISPKTILADLTSVKQGPLAAMCKAHKGPVMGLHPLFGPTLDSLDKQIVVICPGRDDDACLWLKDQLGIWGAIIVQASAQEHDQVMEIVQALRHFFDQDNPAQSGERVDVCKACNSYFLTIDLRQRIDPVNMDVAAMGMIALDILAQEKGYSPLAATPWNLLD